jgi:hypothetical protein
MRLSFVTRNPHSRTAALALVLLTLATGCRADDRAAKAGGPSASSQPSSPSAPAAEADRTAEIYAGVLRHLIQPRRGPVDANADQVFVLDAPNTRLPGSFNERDGGPLEPNTRARIQAAVAVDPPIQWISDRSEVGDDGGMHRGRMVVTLGTVQGGGDVVTVFYTTWCGNLCASGDGLHLARTAEGWKVTGSVGAWVS